MAFSISTIHNSVFGDLRVAILSCTIDSASGNINTGFQSVYGAHIMPGSMATAGITLVRNVGSGATARAGYVNVNSGAAGDVFVLSVYGK
jgi:hypothetical protein